MKKYYILLIILLTLLLTLSITSAKVLNDTQSTDETITHNNNEKINTKQVTKNIEKNRNTKENTQKLETHVSVAPIPATYVGDNVTFTGQVSSGKQVPISTIYITGINTTHKTTTNQYGEYNLTITVPIKGKHTYTIQYEGNNEFESSTTTIQYRGVQRRTVLSYNPVFKEYVGTEIHISGRLSHQETLLKNQEIEIHLNNKTVHTYTDNDGLYSYAFTPQKEENYTVDIYYHGTNIYQENHTQSTFNIIKRNTNLTMSLRAINYYGNISNITGKLVAAGMVVPNAKLSLNINNKTITVYTNKEGKYQYNYTVPNDKNHTVTVTFKGNNSHKACSITKTFQVYKIKTVLYIDPVPETEYYNTATIKGTLITGSKTIQNAKIKLTINSKTITLTTNNTGNYIYNYKVGQIRKNTIRVEYPGNYTYYSSNNTKTFQSTKRNTKITLDYISNKKYNEKIQIRGKLQSNNKTIPNTEITIKYNNQTIKTTTDTNGQYQLTQKTTTMGQNNITITYKGNTKNKATTTNRTFTVTKQKTKITINTIPKVHYTENTNITGKLTDPNKQPIKNTKITIKINNKKYTTQTNNQGTYKLNLKTTKAGKNNLTITCDGNKNYEDTITKTSFTAASMPTKLTLNKIPNKNYEETITITGTLKDKNNKTIINQTINIQINNKNYTTKTNNHGTYKLQYKTTKTGTNKVTTTFNQENYQKSTQYRTFQVKNKQQAQ